MEDAKAVGGPFSTGITILSVCSCVCAKLLWPCPTLCNSVDCSLTGSSVRGILQARMLEWVALPPPGALPDAGTKPSPPLLPLALEGRLFSSF